MDRLLLPARFSNTADDIDTPDRWQAKPEDEKMITPITSEFYRITDCMKDLPDSDIPSLIKQLRYPDDNIRLQAREALICINAPAVPELIKALSTPDVQLRWQIIKVLEGIHNPASIPALVEQLKNDNAGVRWAASNALIDMQRQAIPTLLEGLVHNFDSLWLRVSAHHIFHVLKDTGKLTGTEGKVFTALDGIEPAASVPWAAEKALEALRHTTK